MELFKHTFITITQLNRLYDPESRKILFKKDLPDIFNKNQMYDLTHQEILFANDNDLESNFLTRLKDIIRKATNFQPQISKDLDFNDPKSVERLLMAPEIKKLVEKLEEMSKRNEEMLERARVQAEEAMKINAALKTDLNKLEEEIARQRAKTNELSQVSQSGSSGESILGKIIGWAVTTFFAFFL